MLTFFFFFFSWHEACEICWSSNIYWTYCRHERSPSSYFFLLSAPPRISSFFNHPLSFVCWYYLETPANISDRKSLSSAIYPLRCWATKSQLNPPYLPPLVSPVSSVIRPWCLKQVSLLPTASRRTPNLPTNRTPDLPTNIQQGMWVYPILCFSYLRHSRSQFC